MVIISCRLMWYILSSDSCNCHSGVKLYARSKALTQKMQTNSSFNDCIKNSCVPLFILLAQTWQSAIQHNVLNALLHLTEVRMVKSLPWWMQRCTGVSPPFFAFILLHLQPRGSQFWVCVVLFVCVCMYAFVCNSSPQGKTFKRNSGIHNFCLCMGAMWVLIWVLHVHMQPCMNMTCVLVCWCVYVCVWDVF